MENRSLVTIAEHSKEKILYLLEMAKEFEKKPNRKILDGKVVATLFFEPSTRTRLSFETAANRLGARVIGFTDPKVTSSSTGTYRNTFTNTVNMVVLANDPDVCNDIIDGLANGDFVVVLENKAKGLNKTENPGDSAFQVYGYYQGLKAAEIGNDKYSEETEGGWNISLQETKVPKSALFLYKTSYDATKTLVETLTKPAE